MRAIIEFISFSIILSFVASTKCWALNSLMDLKFEGIERQSLDYSCGASALSILLSDYFGDKYDEKELISDMMLRLDKNKMNEVMKLGFSMLDLKEESERLGYQAAGVKLPISALHKLKGPIIILLDNSKIKHFVILRGIAENRAFITDPARGHVRMPLFELEDQWNGYGLVVGRDGFGLPGEHKLALPKVPSIAPESEAVRSLRYLKVN